MTTMDYHGTASALPVRKVTGRFGLLRSWLEERRQHRRLRNSIMELSRLDERLLRDIGISREDIRDALHGRHSSVLLNPMRRDRRE